MQGTWRSGREVGSKREEGRAGGKAARDEPMTSRVEAV